MCYLPNNKPRNYLSFENDARLVFLKLKFQTERTMQSVASPHLATIDLDLTFFRVGDIDMDELRATIDLNSLKDVECSHNLLKEGNEE